MPYVIATSGRYREETLFMVDRKKQKKSFWSNRLDDVFIFLDRGAAERKAASLTFNSPEVLTYREAQQIDHEQDRDRMEQEALDAMEGDGWDAHKVWQ